MPARTPCYMRDDWEIWWDAEPRAHTEVTPYPYVGPHRTPVNPVIGCLSVPQPNGLYPINKTLLTRL